MHHPGLMQYAPDPGAYEAFLAQIRASEVRTLRVVTMPSDEPVAMCTGSMTCECASCVAERVALMSQGSRDRIQPWQRAA